MTKKKIALTVALLIVASGALVSYRAEAQETGSLLFTDRMLTLRAPTRVEESLTVEGTLSAEEIRLENNFTGSIELGTLTGSRSYRFPNLSGEICLSAGNCDFAPRGTADFVARFTADGLDDSSIRDLYDGEAITISDSGEVGVGLTPTERLHVAGRIRAEEDVCTDLRGGVCLSELDEGIGEGFEEMQTFPDYVVEGHGTPGFLPLWDEDVHIRDSVLRQSGSNIGIGTWPGHTLDVSGTVRMLGFRLPVSPREGYGLMSDDDGFGTWQPVLQPEGTRADIAEKFPCTDCPQPGELVALSGEVEVERSKEPYQATLLGVVSTDPAMTLGVREDEEAVAVALIGRVPTKVSTENGAIEVGDKLTSSSTEGVAKKATGSGRVIGIALESFDGDQGRVKAFINPHEAIGEELKITDQKSGEVYCLTIYDGELNYELCQ